MNMGKAHRQIYFTGNCTSCFSSFHTRHQINNPDTVICDLCQQNRLKGIINPIPKMVLSLNDTIKEQQKLIDSMNSSIKEQQKLIDPMNSSNNKKKYLICILLLYLIMIYLY